MSQALTRRTYLKWVVYASWVISLGSKGMRAVAAPLTPLDPDDPTAKSLGFVSDAARVDVHENPTFKPGQHCGLCAQFQGRVSDPRGPCAIFADHSVPSTGWCRVWSSRSD